MTIADLARFDTFPKLLRHHAEARGTRPAMREKDRGIWQTWSWAEQAAEVRALACGLADLGLARGDRLTTIGDNRPRLYWSIAAAQALGALPVPVYQDSVAEELLYILDHAGSRVVVAEDQEQVDKLLQIRDRLPDLAAIVYDDPRGLDTYPEDFLLSYEQLIERGRAYDAANPGFFDAAVDAGSGADRAIICYTSGTTGRPKGVVLTYANLVQGAAIGAEFEGLDEKDDALAYLPMAWLGDNVLSYGQSHVVGSCISCPESPETLLNDLRELGPTYFFAPPRIYETMLTNVMIRMEDAGPTKRWLFRRCTEFARGVGPRLLDGEPVGLLDRIRYAIGHALVFGPLKNVLGLSRVRIAYTAGESIGPEIFTFFRSLGINLKQLYGQTEAAVFVTIQTNDDVRPETVEPAAPKVELRIEDSGEVMYRSPGVFLEYYRNPEATAATKTPDGWVHTGDAGFIDDTGHLHIIDRAKDVGRLAGGELFAPKYIENKLKFFPTIREAVAVGDGRPYCAVMINVGYGAISNWAGRNNIAFASYQDLSGRPEVYDLVEAHIAEVNESLAREPAMAASRIRRFLVLPKLLDADDGELTRTQKVRRGFIAEKYAGLIRALYDGSASAYVETQVNFEDGRQGMVRGDVAIRDVAVDRVLDRAAE